MTPTRQIAANGRVYTVVDDFTSVCRAVITGTVADETFGGFDAVNFTVRPIHPDLDAKTTSGGAYAVIGYPEKSFPKLAVLGANVDLVLSAPGFKDQMLTVSIPAGASFPFPAASIALRRQPIRIQGRVVTDTPSRLPIAAADIAAVDDASTPPGKHVIALRTPLSLPHAAEQTSVPSL